MHPSFRSILDISVAIVAIVCAQSTAFAQSAGGGRPPNAIAEDVNPKVIPGLVKPAADSGRHGPLAPLADRLAAEGITLHALSIDFLTSNPSAGLRPGHAENSLYNILGVDIDLSKRAGLGGSSLHYETTIFAGNTNFDSFLQQVGDNGLGYQGTYNKKTAVLSLATFEQKLFNDRLDIEIGRTHPNHYYAPPQCQSLDSCFQDILYFNAGFTSPQYSVWGANVAYHVTPSIYVQAGAFSTNDGARIGYDLGRERNTGVLGIAEIGSKTDFDTEAYPSRWGVTGFINTASHADLNAQSAFNPNAGMTVQGTSGVVVQGQKIVWRADGGRERTNAPTSIAIYGSAGTALDSTTPILSDVFVGATLQSPFEGRPADRFGVKVDWERTNPNYTAYLGAANFVSGGSGAPYRQDKFVFEANAHIQLPGGLAFEPVVQYAINPNSFYDPLTARRSRDGVFAIGTLVIPVGVLLGLAPG